MATTEFGVNHPLAVKLWSKLLAREAHRLTFFGKFMGSGRDAMIQVKEDLKKSAGDRITCGLKVQLQGDGVEGDATLEGNEEALQFYDDSVLVNQLRHATRSKGKMSEQRVPYNIREEGRDSLADWWARRKDEALFNQLCGYTVETDSRRTGHNTVIAPSTNRIIRAGGVANDNSLTSGDKFTLDLVTKARVKAENASTEDGTGPLIRPFRHMGEDVYVMFLHDFQVYDMMQDTSTNMWTDIQKAAMQGGDVAKNPIFTGALGMYNGVILHKASKVTPGVSAADGSSVSNTRRAVLCGAQAATVAYGGDSGPTRYSWVEEMFDLQNQLAIGSGCIWGVKKTRFTPADDSSTNAEDFGTVVVSTYAADPNA